MENFSRMELEGWRQFGRVDIDLSGQVTVLTGQNGCGKTTILNILNRHFGWTLQLVSTPVKGKGSQRFWSDILRSTDEIDKLTRADPSLGSYSGPGPGPGIMPGPGFGPGPGAFVGPSVRVGKIEYTNGAVCELNTNPIVAAQYHVGYSAMQNVEGLHIPSHRPVATYTAIESIPTAATTAAQAYQQFQQMLIALYGGGMPQNPGRIQKQSLISLAVFGEGNASVQPNAELRKLFESFQEVLRQVMPAEMGFERLEVRMPEVVCVTTTGDFSLDAMSGGINAIFSIAWQIHMFGYAKSRFVVTIDEPENHLHPSIQRSLLPNLAAAFPQCSFIVATHSPFIVSSFPDANVYALARNSSGKIVSDLLGRSDLSKTPNDILREILDVHSNLPLWVEERISQVINDTGGDGASRARRIMEELDALGFADAIVEYKRGEVDAKDH